MQVTPLIAAMVALVQAAEAADAVHVSGDARSLISGLERSDRDGSEIHVDEAFLRLRAGMKWDLSDAVEVVGRVATTAWTGGNDWEVGTFPEAQTSAGLAPGNVTLDLAYLRLRVTPRFHLHLGRFQESLQLPAVPDKSLDRKDSDSVAISYSDGVAAHYDLGKGWSLLGIAQYQPPEGATNRPRAPLSFEDDASRVSGFFAIQRSDEEGPWALRSLSFSAYPQALVEGGESRTYTTVVGNVMRQFAREGNRAWTAGGSIGYAPEVPATASESESAHWAWQGTVNLMNFAPREQSIGVVYMETGSGWLVSPDLADNSWLAELRYRIVPIDAFTAEVRLRYRGDVMQFPGASQSRLDRDWYLRLTWRF